MRIERAPLLARGIFIADLTLLGVAALLDPSTALTLLLLLIPLLGWGGVGALIAIRAPRNSIGWLLLVVATSGAFLAFATNYAAWGGPGTGRDDLPLAEALLWLQLVVTSPLGIAALPLLFLEYPDGSLPSPRWRPMLWLIAAIVPVVGLNGIATALPDAGVYPPGWASQRLADITSILAAVLLVAASAGALASLWVKSRRAPVDERGPIRWLFYLLAAGVGSTVIGLATAAILQASGLDYWFALILPGLIVFGGVLFGIPFAFWMVLLRYGLYDYEVRTRKKIVATVLTLLLTGASLFLVSFVPRGIAGHSEMEPVALLLGAGSAILALVLYRLFRRFTHHVVYGDRATPYEVLSEFSERIGETYGTEDVLPRMAQLLAANTGAKATRVWVRVGDEFRSVAGWPTVEDAAVPVSADGTGFGDGTSVFPVAHRGEMLGALTVVPSANDPMNPQKDRLAQDLAAQAGLVLRNVALVEDLRESRRRIVTAQDERARRLERNIHDGAQQQLVALAVQAKLARSLVERDPAKAIPILDQVAEGAQGALDDLRDLARGIYPPLLADKGLAAAVEAQARKAAMPVTVRCEDLGRFPAEIEAAVYFCVLEALNNAAKYAGASPVEVRLSTPDGILLFEVADQGPGFDPSAAGVGTGLQGMTDRLEALGGTLRVDAAPGRGAVVRGSVAVTAGG